MSDDYSPRAGTAAHKIIEFLRKQAPGAAFSGQELEAKLKIKHASMAMRKAVAAEVVATEKRGNAYVFSLAAPPQPSDGKLTIGCYSDGDTVVAGGAPNEDGSVTYSREQLLQLIRFVSAPAIGMPVHSELLSTTPLLTASAPG